MDSEETVVPVTAPTEGATEQVEANDATEAEKVESTEPKEDKPAKTPEQRELERARRRIDKLTKRLHERDAIENYKASQKEYDPPQDDEPVTLTRAELQQKIREEALKVAPTVKEQQALLEHRQAVISALDKDFGTEKFNEIAADLDEAVGGLADRKGNPRPIADFIFESENPRALIEYLADPEHEDEARAIGKMTAIQAARTIVKIEAKLSEKPKPSKAEEPLSAIKSSGTGKKSLFEMSDKEFFESRRNHGKRK